MTAPVYREENACSVRKELDELKRIVGSLQVSLGRHELITAAFDAIGRLESTCQATLPVTRGGSRVGFGIDKMQKAIACDQAIAIIKQIKALRAW